MTNFVSLWHFSLENKRLMEEYLICSGFQINYECWQFSREALSTHDFETITTYTNCRVEYNDEIYEMLNDKFGFPKADASNKDTMPLGQEWMTEDAETITPY